MLNTFDVISLTLDRAKTNLNGSLILNTIEFFPYQNFEELGNVLYWLCRNNFWGIRSDGFQTNLTEPEMTDHSITVPLNWL